MKTIILIILSAVLFVGCTNSDIEQHINVESSGCTPALSQWLKTCIIKLANNQKSEVRWFNGMGANDAEFIPEVNPVEEIFLKCQSIELLPADKVYIYKKCLKDCISEIKSITTETTRGKVNQLLCQNGGIATPSAAIYSHKDCIYLKVRVEFNAVKHGGARLELREDDKVKAVSMPYLGSFIYD